MPTVEIDDRFYQQLTAFKPVVDAVLGDTMAWQAYVEMVLHVGLDKMLMDQIGHPDVAVATLRKLADLEPELVCQLISLAWNNANEQDRAEARQKLEDCKKWVL